MASATVATGGDRPRSAVISTRATAQATVRLIQGQIVRLGFAEAADPRQRATTVHLADGEHDAIIVEFE
ncbi:MAG: hypothetical protein ABIO68_03860 [Sphingomicrobium sp.]